MRPGSHRGSTRRLLCWVIPSLLLNGLAAYLMRPEPIRVSPRARTYELDLVGLDSPDKKKVAPPLAPDRVTSKPRRVAKKAALAPVTAARKRTRKKAAAKKRLRPAKKKSRVRAVAPTVARPVAKQSKPAKKRPQAVSSLLLMRRPRAVKSLNLSSRPSTIAPAVSPPDSVTKKLRVGAHQLQLRRYADGGRLLSNVSGARVQAPERAGFWRTKDAPKGDAARMSLAGLASIVGGRRGKACNHFKRFPSLSKKRTVHLLIDSSPSMSGNITPAEVCAIAVAHSALQQGYKVAVGRFGASTICQPPTQKSHLIRNVVVNRRRIGGTLVPSTCGADKASEPVDLVIITDGGFMRTDILRMLEVKRAIAGVLDRGLLYLVPESRASINPAAVATFRAIGFRIVSFGGTS
jgi:hypothetical protein